jgi:hypothetical protein
MTTTMMMVVEIIISTGPVAGSSEHSNETSGSIEVEKFLDCMSDCWYVLTNKTYFFLAFKHFVSRF